MKESLQETGGNIADKGRGMFILVMQSYECPWLIKMLYLLDVKEGLKDMGEGAKQSLKDARSDVGEKRQGMLILHCSLMYACNSFGNFDWILEAERSLKEAETEAPKKSKGLMGTIRDWVAPVADKTKGNRYRYLS